MTWKDLRLLFTKVTISDSEAMCGPTSTQIFQTKIVFDALFFHWINCENWDKFHPIFWKLWHLFLNFSALLLVTQSPTALKFIQTQKITTLFLWVINQCMNMTPRQGSMSQSLMLIIMVNELLANSQTIFQLYLLMS